MTRDLVNYKVNGFYSCEPIRIAQISLRKVYYYPGLISTEYTRARTCYFLISPEYGSSSLFRVRQPCLSFLLSLTQVQDTQKGMKYAVPDYNYIMTT